MTPWAAGPEMGVASFLDSGFLARCLMYLGSGGCPSIQFDNTVAKRVILIHNDKWNDRGFGFRAPLNLGTLGLGPVGPLQ